ncbi:MAG: hypothetical protein KC910_04115, partial [Candidatus Eremiobacteraeota bacterium]|nr:hypothetical protein [Candidatus Eremiobacteraeota bacterium]
FYPRGLFFENQYQVLSRVLPPPLKVIHRGEDATSMASVVEIEKAFFHYVDPTRAEPVLVRHRDIFHSNWRGVGGTGIYLWSVTGAYLASPLHPEPRKVLLIGYGSGRLLTTLLRLDRAHSIEVAEINRQNFVNSSHLYLDAERALSDPRVSVTVTDGRNFLLLARERKYEVIVVDVGGLSGEGTEFFYTQEFLELCRQRLEPDGIVMTWMGLGQLTARPGWSYQKTMASVFDEVTLWWGTREMSSSGYLWVVGANQPLEVDYAQLEQTWGDLEEFQRQELALAGLEGPEDFASLFATRVADPVPRHLSEARILTDLHPHHPVHGRGKERVDPGSRTAGMNHLLNANRRLPVSGAPARVVQRRQQFLQTLNQRYTGERYE